MDVSQIQQRVRDIAANTPDFECAHGMEDDLYRDVLRSVAATSTDPAARAKAAAALEAAEIDFERHCA